MVQVVNETLLQARTGISSLLIQCNPLKNTRRSENDSLTLVLILPFSFYTVNEVQKFQYSRPVRKGEKDPDNEFAVSFLLFFYAWNISPFVISLSACVKCSVVPHLEELRTQFF